MTAMGGPVDGATRDPAIEAGDDSTADPGPESPVTDDTTAAAGGDDATSGAGGWRTEGLLLVEVAALAAFAFSRPVLDSFGRSPETFIARDADAAVVVWFALIVSFVPALVLGAIGVGTRLLGPGRRRWAHIGLVGVLGGALVWRVGQDVTGLPGSATRMVVAGAVGVPL